MAFRDFVGDNSEMLSVNFSDSVKRRSQKDARCSGDHDGAVLDELSIQRILARPI